RDVEADVTREVGADVDLVGQHLRVLRDQQDVVEGQGSGEVGADGKLSPRLYIHVSTLLLSMALLVFLAAAARARVVASDLRLIAAHGLDDRVVAADARRLAVRCGRRGDRRAGGARERRRRLFRGSAQNQRLARTHGHAARQRRLGAFFRNHGTQPPQELDGLLVDAAPHVLEEIEALLLVLDERILLAVAAKADAFLEMVEAVEVIFPLRVDDLQHDVALDALEDLAADDRFFLVVRLRDHFPELLFDFIRRAVAEIEGRRVDREHLADLALERLEIPLLVVGLARGVRLHETVENALGDVHQVLARADDLFLVFLVLERDLALEDLPAQRVDVLALLI